MTVYLSDPDVTIHHGDALETLRGLEAGSVDCCITSPPYWGLRDYGTPGQLGLEATPDEYVARMVVVFEQVRRVLAGHGTLWLNLGDSYAGSSAMTTNEKALKGKQGTNAGTIGSPRPTVVPPGLKPKDLVGAPWMVAFALRAAGWYLRSEIIWAKPNPMPESVTDRPTKAHEQVFLLSKARRYWYDAEAVREPHARLWGSNNGGSWSHTERQPHGSKAGHHSGEYPLPNPAGRNVRSVWEIATQPYPDAHFATYPEELVRRCLLAGCPEWVCRDCGKPRERIVERETSYDHTTSDPGKSKEGPYAAQTGNGAGTHDVRHGVFSRTQTLGWSDCGHQNYRPGIVLDPFLGSGTTAHVARRHGRRCVGIELSGEYCRLIGRRLQQLSLLAEAPA